MLGTLGKLFIVIIFPAFEVEKEAKLVEVTVALKNSDGTVI